MLLENRLFLFVTHKSQPSTEEPRRYGKQKMTNFRI